MTTASVTTIQPDRFDGTRYRLLDQIGTGAMGRVFRAFDRLGGTEVALKQIALSGWQPDDTATDAGLQLALASEFQALAALRHPHIIAVRDYGFDNLGQPYFTMDLLRAPTAVTVAAQWADDATRARWLWQLLLALDYIHRAGIVHRDLKPGNVLVVNGSVRVVDFGLATLAGAPGAPSGTPGYVAPELLDGAPPGVASDLYAVGVIAYELFVGWHPYGATVARLAERARRQPLDFSYAAVAAPLQAVIAQLAAHDPAARFPHARAAIGALAAATGLLLPTETTTTRESYLIAAPFTGRQREMAALTEQLAAARAGSGSGWLIAGESGIGKSRLLAELRTRALVAGVVVAAGEAQETDASAYRLFADVVRRLLLLAPPDDHSAAVLAAIVPDVATLLQRALPPAPALPPDAAQLRLHAAVLALVSTAAARRPLLLLLEDLHWADAASLALLKYLVDQLADLRVLLLASYRPGERHDLAALLPTMHPLALGRLETAYISALAGAMLTGQQPAAALLTLLERETEGNTFFLVEVLRTLAEEAGDLAQVGTQPLPSAVSAGGVQRVIARRLGRVPEAQRPLLVAAAVAGRRLDLRLLQTLDPTADLDGWLTVCANCGVLNQPVDRLHWQFSHDKLRSGLLALLTPVRIRDQHAAIARALEATYADDLAPHYAALAYHYSAADERVPTIHYLQLAAAASQQAYAHAAVLDYLEQLHPLLDAVQARADVALQIGRTLRFVGRLEDAAAHVRAALGAADALADRRLRAEALLELGRLARVRADYPAALDALHTAADLYAAAHVPDRLCEATVDLANVYYQQAQYTRARDALDAVLPAAAKAGAATQALVWHNLGSVAYAQGQYDEAEALYRQALALRRQIDDRVEIGNSLNNLGLVAFRRKRYAEALQLLQDSLAVRREVGDRLGVAAALNNLGMLPYQQGDYQTARRYWEECVAVRRTIGARWQLLQGLDNLALVMVALGDYNAAAPILDEIIAERRAINDRQGLLITLGNRGRLALRLQQSLAAAHDYLESSTLAAQAGDQLGVVFGLAGVAAAVSARAADRDTCAQALRLCAAAERLRLHIAAGWETDEQQLFEATCADLTAVLGAPMAGAIWQAAIDADDDPAGAAALTLAAQLVQVLVQEAQR